MDYKKSIIKLIEQISSEKLLRRIYLILTVMIQGQQ